MLSKRNIILLVTCTHHLYQHILRVFQVIIWKVQRSCDPQSRRCGREPPAVCSRCRSQTLTLRYPGSSGQAPLHLLHPSHQLEPHGLVDSRPCSFPTVRLWESTWSRAEPVEPSHTEKQRLPLPSAQRSPSRTCPGQRPWRAASHNHQSHLSHISIDVKLHWGAPNKVLKVDKVVLSYTTGGIQHKNKVQSLTQTA